MNQSIKFLQAIDAFHSKDIPKEVLERAKQSLLDYLAVCSAGAAFQKEKIDNYMEFAMPETGEFNTIGTGKRLSLKEAVFLNGLMRMPWTSMMEPIPVSFILVLRFFHYCSLWQNGMT